MKRVILVVCDGLRADMICPAWTPNLFQLKDEACIFNNHKSVFPSTTRVTAASIATGCYPAKHGLEGNSIALDEGDGLNLVSVGPASFRDRLRKATGRTLKVPTISERLSQKGQAVIFSDVSPGAAYFHDPDGYGFVYHRSCSYGPGLLKISDSSHLLVSHDVKGDRVMTNRFCDEILKVRKPCYSVLWQCEPDHTQHCNPLGSPQHLAALLASDFNIGKVCSVVEEESKKGDDILLIVASDHGHETVTKILPLEKILIETGLKQSASSSDVVVASNGLSANIYLSEDGLPRLKAIIDFLSKLEEIDGIFHGTDLCDLGHNPNGALAISVTTKNSKQKNKFGIKGVSVAIEDPLHSDTRVGCGQHGGLGSFEQNPFLMIKGSGFIPGTEWPDRTSAVDIAPTVLAFLDESFTDLDGTPLSCS